MRLWRRLLLVLAAAVVVVIGLALAGVGNGLALLAYVLFIAALLFALVARPAEDGAASRSRLPAHGWPRTGARRPRWSNSRR